jgi:ABC-type branched-subunit amino acid transport system substrate-binding protein
VKRKNEKIGISIGLILLLAPFIASNAVGSLEVNQVTEVKVGLLTPQSGGLSAYTGGFERAAELAISELNDHADFADYSFTLSKYDTKTDPTGASEAMTAAATAGVHYVVGAAGSSNTLAAAAVAVANKIPMISYASTSPALTTFDDHAVSGDEGYLWRTPPSDALQGQVIADLAKAGGFKNMVIVTLDNAYGSGLANATRDEFEAGTDAGEVLAIIAYPETTVDFSGIVTQISGEEPDIVVAISYGTDGAELFVEMDTQNLDVQVIGADGVADASIFGEKTGTQDAMQGFVLTKPSATQEFLDKYKAEYPTATGDIYTGETYDAVYAGARAILAADSVAGEDIIAELANVSFEGAIGTVSFDENGDSNAGFYLISEVQDDKLVTVANWDTVNFLTLTDSDFESRWSGSDESDSPFPFFAFISAFAVVYAISRKRKN